MEPVGEGQARGVEVDLQLDPGRLSAAPGKRRPPGAELGGGQGRPREVGRALGQTPADLEPHLAGHLGQGEDLGHQADPDREGRGVDALDPLARVRVLPPEVVDPDLGSGGQAPSQVAQQRLDGGRGQGLGPPHRPGLQPGLAPGRAGQDRRPQLGQPLLVGDEVVVVAKEVGVAPQAGELVAVQLHLVAEGDELVEVAHAFDHGDHVGQGHGASQLQGGPELGDPLLGQLIRYRGQGLVHLDQDRGLVAHSLGAEVSRRGLQPEGQGLLQPLRGRLVGQEVAVGREQPLDVAEVDVEDPFDPELVLPVRPVFVEADQHVRGTRAAARGEEGHGEDLGRDIGAHVRGQAQGQRAVPRLQLGVGRHLAEQRGREPAVVGGKLDRGRHLSEIGQDGAEHQVSPDLALGGERGHVVQAVDTLGLEHLDGPSHLAHVGHGSVRQAVAGRGPQERQHGGADDHAWREKGQRAATVGKHENKDRPKRTQRGATFARTPNLTSDRIG